MKLKLKMRRWERFKLYLIVDAGFIGDVRWRRFIFHHSFQIAKPYDLQYPRILDFVLMQKGWNKIIAPSSCRCSSAKSKSGCNQSFDSWFQAGMDEGGFDMLGTGRPSGISTRIKSKQGWSSGEPLWWRVCLLSAAQSKENKTQLIHDKWLQ
jgi:hypothetical protein